MSLILLLSECAQDNMNMYCGDIVKDPMFPNDLQNMITDCSSNSECSGDCQSTIESVSYRFSINFLSLL